MPQVRLHARVPQTDITTPIAYCRHAQARILLKHGLAEELDGKIILKEAVAAPQDPHPMLRGCWDALEAKGAYNKECLGNVEQFLPLLEALPKCIEVIPRLDSTGEPRIDLENKEYQKLWRYPKDPEVTDPPLGTKWVSGNLFVGPTSFTFLLNRYTTVKKESKEHSLTLNETPVHNSQESLRARPKAGEVVRLGPPKYPSKGEDPPRPSSRFPIPEGEDILDLFIRELAIFSEVVENPDAPWVHEMEVPGEES